MSTQKKYDAIVCGGGFRGIMSAILMARSDKRVCLVEASPRLGGVLNSIPWKNYYLDIGCHLFDNSSEELTKLFFEIHSDFLPVEVTYHSVMDDGKVAKDMAQPDLTLTEADLDKVLSSLDEAIANNKGRNSSNYDEYLVNRFGEYNAAFLRKCAQKKVGVSPDVLCPSASSVVLMDRVKLLDDKSTSELKRQAEYDSRLALPSSEQPMLHYPEVAKFYEHRNFYPEQNGMGSFCRALESYLGKIGVNVVYQDKVLEIAQNKITLQSGAHLQAEKIIWSNELPELQNILYQDTTLQNLLHPVAAVLVYFEVPVEKVSDVTYLHDYRNNSPCFRISTAGKYGKQINDSNTYICAEIFTDTGSEFWNIDEHNCEKVWSQVNELGVVDCKEPTDVKVIKHPSAYKLPLLGYFDQKQAFLNLLKVDYPNIFIFDKPSFAKQHIYEQVREIVRAS